MTNLKLKYIFVAFLMIGLFLTASAYAANISLSPQSFSVKEGQNVSIDISVDPQGAVYTVKTVLSFPVDLLEAVSFTPASSWFALTQKGYDLMDNTGGFVIKTGGYPGGLKSAGKFGTMVFRAKKSGVANVQVTGASLAYNAQNQNSLSGTQGSSVVTISSIVTTPIPVSAPTNTNQGVTPKTNNVSTPNIDNNISSVENGEDVVSTTSPETEDQIAAAGTVNFGFLKEVVINWWFWLAIILLCGYLAWYYYFKKNEN